MKRSHLVLSFFVILLIGSLLRLFHLGTQGLFFDEAWSWSVTQLSVIEILTLPTKDPHPILYYLVLKAILIVLPDTESGLRALSVACSLAAIGLVFFFVARKWNQQAAFYAGWFMAFSTFDLYYAQETRMYTLLAFFWILSYILLIEAMQRAVLLLAWCAVTVAMVWTHFYGLLVAFVLVTFLIAWWAWQKRKGCPPFGAHWLALNLGLLVLGTLPMIFILLGYRSSGAGGAWIPDPFDIVKLFALWSVGLTAVRGNFLDSANLLWFPFMAPLSVAVWALIGFFLSGIHAVRGLLRNWQQAETQRLAAILAFLLMSVPVLLTFSYATIMQRPMWALKPFLGAAYLFYMWVGIGLSSFSSALLRRSVAGMMLVIALLSLLPYYTTWQKTNASHAFGTLPPLNQQKLVILNPGYLSHYAHYYLQSDVKLWTNYFNAEEEPSFYRFTNRPHMLTPPEAVTCASSDLNDVQEIWIYGHQHRILSQWEKWPACLIEKKLFYFEDPAWKPLNH